MRVLFMILTGVSVLAAHVSVAQVQPASSAGVAEWSAMELAELAQLIEDMDSREEGSLPAFARLGTHGIERVAAAVEAGAAIDWLPCLEIPIYFRGEMSAELRESVAAEIGRQLGGKNVARLSDIDAGRVAQALRLTGSVQAGEELAADWLKSADPSKPIHWNALYRFATVVGNPSPVRAALAIKVLERSADASGLISMAEPWKFPLIMRVFRADLTAAQKSKLTANFRAAFFDDPSVLRSLDAEHFRYVCSAFTMLGDAEVLTAAATAAATTLSKEARQTRVADPWVFWGETAGLMRDADSRNLLYTQVQNTNDGSVALAGLLAKAHAGTGELNAWRKTLETDAAKTSGDVRARIFMARAIADGVEAQPHLILRGKAWLDRSLGAAQSAPCRQMILALLIRGYIEAEQFEDASAILNSVSEQFADSPEPLRAMRAEVAAGREQVMRRTEQFKRDEEAQLLRLRQERLGEQLKKAEADGDRAKADEIRQALNRLAPTSGT